MESEVSRFKNELNQIDNEIETANELREKSKTNFENSSKTWFGKSKNQRIEITEENVKKEFVDLDKSVKVQNEAKPGTSFRKSLKSFFRKETDVENKDLTLTIDQEILSDHDTSDSDSDTVEDKEKVLDKPNDTPPVSHHFWQTWKHGKFHRSSVSQADFKEDMKNEDHLCNKIQAHATKEDMLMEIEEKRLRNMRKLEENLMSVSPNIDNTAPIDDTKLEDHDCSEDDDSQSSSFERANLVRDRVNSLFSPNAKKSQNNTNNTSPLTPLNFTELNKSYKHVFEVPNEYTTVTSNFDNMILDRRSAVYQQLQEAFELIQNKHNCISNSDSPKEVSIVQVISDLVASIKSRFDAEDISKAENENLQLSLIELQTNLKITENKNRQLENKYDEKVVELNNALTGIRNLNDQIIDLNEKSQSKQTYFDFELVKYKDQLHELDGYKTENKQLIQGYEDIEKLINETNSDSFESREEFDLGQTKLIYRNLKGTKAFEVAKSYLELKKSYHQLQKKEDLLKSEFSNKHIEVETLQENILSLQMKLRSATNSLELNNFRRNDEDDSVRSIRSELNKYQKQFNVERQKVQILKQHSKIQRMYLDAYETYRSSSLQYLIYMMHYFKSFVTTETMEAVNDATKLFNKFSFNENVLHHKTRQVEKDCTAFQDSVCPFFEEIAKSKYLDEICNCFMDYQLTCQFFNKKRQEFALEKEDNEKTIRKLTGEINHLKFIRTK